MTYQGMEKLYDALELKKDDVFYDLGCGVGKLVLYVALRGGPQRSVGLEVGQRRFSLAEGARNSIEDIEGKKEEPSATECRFQRPGSDEKRAKHLEAGRYKQVSLLGSHCRETQDLWRIEIACRSPC